MKTIEQAAEEYADSLKLDDAHRVSKQQFKEYAQSDFKAGVEFAQRWIPVDKSLPVIRPCLLKNENLHKFDTNYITYVGHHDLISIADVLKATHWRPIEYK